MMDATKAFYHVKYCKLFKLLTERGLPPVIVRLLLNMYAGHLITNSWNDVYFNRFPVKSRVKQGSVISPVCSVVILISDYLSLRLMELTVLYAKCLSEHWHMLMILCLLRQRLMQCVACCLLVIVLLIISRLYSMLKKQRANI